MPKRITPLSDTKIRAAKPTDNPLTIFDGGGLYLLITPVGGKLWRFKYRFEGKEKLLSLGAYPEISLADARQRREEARSQVAHGIDPGALRKAQKLAETEETETFGVIAREWYAKFCSAWSPGHAEAIKNRMEKDLIPWLGKLPMKNIKVPMVVESLQRIEARGALETAHRVRTIFGQVCRYALATGRIEHDISSGLRGALPQPPERHHAAITDPKEVGPLLRAIDGYQGHFMVRCALKLAPMLFVRPGELRRAEWAEIDLDGAVWSIPAAKMKMKEPHIVPLCRQAVEILTELKELTGASRYVFPSTRSFTKPMSENTVNAAIRYLGYDRETMTGHGFRAMARTILDEVLHVNPYVIEAQLAHKVPDPLGRAYNRTTHLPERLKMMQEWADYLGSLKAGAMIIPFRTVGR
jgi:integrase